MNDDRPSDRLAVLRARDDLLEAASCYETVAALDLTPTSENVGHTPPGSRLPPGMQEILDADEIRRVVTEVDDWAAFLAHVLLDEREVTGPPSTPARLRTAGREAAHFIDHEDEMLALAFCDDLADHLRALRRLSRRGVRRVRTGMRCHRLGCAGQLVSPLGGNDRKDDALVCDKCGDRIEYVVWSHWPRARVQYITVEHAARMLATTVSAVYVRASRGKWRKVGTGRDVRYSVEDVRAAAGLDDTPDVRVDIEQHASNL